MVWWCVGINIIAKGFEIMPNELCIEIAYKTKQNRQSERQNFKKFSIYDIHFMDCRRAIETLTHIV